MGRLQIVSERISQFSVQQANITISTINPRVLYVLPVFTAKMLQWLRLLSVQ